jgi:putative transposase
MKKTLRHHGSPEAITTDGLRSYGAAMTELGNREKQGSDAGPTTDARTATFRSEDESGRYLRFRRKKSLQKFASVHANVHNHFALERHLVDRRAYTASLKDRKPPCGERFALD